MFLEFLTGLCRYLLVVLSLLSIAGCTEAYRKDDDALDGRPAPREWRLSGEAHLAQLATEKVSYARDVQPILDSRCVVCHGCYDAPCQLKMEAFEGLERGGSKTTVYDSTRIHAIAPTRLFVDAENAQDWRSKGFFPVLNERRDSSEANLMGSLLYRMLQQKKEHPLPTSGVLPDTFDFTLDRPLSCPTIEEFDDFAAKHPEWGMPYGFPGLSERERNVLVAWLHQGAVAPPPAPVSPEAAAAVARWEAFLNGSSSKERLFARYVYEHVFIGNLHFRGLAPREFFRLVRSRTPPGEPIREIATTRPYDSPGPGTFYYRLRPVRQSIVDKIHMVYELDDARMRRYRELFLEPEYAVGELPGYAAADAANPFKTFVAIPPRSRYRFLLDDAYFFFSGFMKGPVCRGQVALNVIQDRFWVAFTDPDTDPVSNDARFLANQADRLRLPAEKENAPGIADIWYTYWALEEDYQAAKAGWLRIHGDRGGPGLEQLWDGDGGNRDALLTVFRHFDSASVERGLVGDTPLTAWVVDYPLLERIHYLLVAGFDVFGNVGHQLATRLYMDFMRMEAENNFLRFLPANMRQAERMSWYKGVGGEINNLVQNPLWDPDRETGIGYRTSDPKKEFFDRVRVHFGKAAGDPDPFVGCRAAECGGRAAIPSAQAALERKLRPLAFLRGGGIAFLPELSYVRIRAGSHAPDDGWIYSLVKNAALENVSMLFLEELRREPREDTLTVVRGVVGSYPNFFFDLDEAEVDEFVDAVLSLESPEGFAAKLAERFGVHRGNPGFWKISDWFNRRHLETNPVTAGWLDLSRYDNL
ncbi:fatty acid cis/trans isomerase [Methylococcus geothermalis]|uniref:Isomerase n=1 Tax=Methylococcus geothermalis TaxID=2681310 RepID=A0A858Q8X7_9GAMM|nr:fatty acid cis/trans isomerase [Methylococcus geothermalis]QJD30204.1 isomerase [Methylococcus geothermalis]